jgi:tRNA pseudouridine38-40 synthase
MNYNYQIIIEYDGLNFVGWQYQKNGVSIQEIIERSLKKIFKKKIRVIGSGRTDKGVHAIAQSANFKINKKIENKNKFLNSINFFLSKYNVSIIDIKKKEKNFHARYNAKERTYLYKIVNRQSNLVIDLNRAWHIKKKLDVNLIKKGSIILVGTHDFSTFRSSSCSAKSAIKTINSIKVKKIDNTILLEFKSKSFLQNQVRSMVGCLKYLAEKKWSLKKFKYVLNTKKRINCAPPAPAPGLYLLKIKY